MNDNHMTIAELHEYQRTGRLPARLRKPQRSEVITQVAATEPELAEKAAKRKNKYGAQPTEVGGIRFASKKEAARYLQLQAMQQAGEIYDLAYEPRRYVFEHNGVRIGTYTPDFEYRLASGEHVVEDTKSKATRKARDYGLRKKMMKAFYGIEVKET